MGDKAPSIIGVISSFLAVSWIVVGLRCYVRVNLSRWGVDDLLVVFALLIYSAFGAMLIYATKHGFGKHSADIKSLHSMVNASKSFFIADILYLLVTGVVKISFCFSLLRVVVIGRGYVYAIYTVITLSIIFTVFYFFFTLFTCYPVSFLWSKIENPHGAGKCQNFTNIIAATYVHGSVICLGDLTLAIVPALMLRKLQLNYRSKISVSFLLGFGSVASIATIARLTYVKNIFDAKDFLYTNTEIMIWGVVEVGVSIIAISAVTLKPLMVKYKIFFHSGNNNVSSPFDRGRVYRAGDDSFRYAIGPGAQRKGYNSRLHTSSTHGKMDSLRMGDDTIIAQGRSSSEENIWASKGGEESIAVSDGNGDDFELVPRGKIHKVVEFSTSRATNQPEDDPISVPEHAYTERP
ncbi:hypothetical protein ACJ72_06803 [Emergomyces africanus]|uniref:Rhodopsin domain-containing protein n=1 Tax=Emergomyces africanus TaxID=1955775 RepID=A0A1B7NQ22_9EURO|nr:hypothetical protein ACJ72_06803 [Emergomyces africanus]